MGAILGALGFIMAFAAIWFTTEALRRADGKGDALIRPYIRDIKSRLSDNQALLLELDKRLGAIERKVENLQHETHASSELQGQVEAVRYGVDQARNFQPSSIYNA